MAYQKCPICNGNGIVSGGFYGHPGDYPYWTTGHTTEQCRTCQGKGVIVDEIKTRQERDSTNKDTSQTKPTV